MPTYEYACGACGHRFEEFQSITAKAIRKCPVCKKLKVNRLISSGAGFIFKGSGFYITDYRSDGYKAAAKSDTGAAAGAASTPSTPSTPSTAGETGSAGAKADASAKPSGSAAGKGKGKTSAA